MSKEAVRIDVKAAVKAAYQYLQSLQEVMGNPLKDLALEEVELSEDGHFWLITLGYDRSIASLGSALLGGLPSNQRVYKLFRVNSETGEVGAMKIREP
jgi:hypothetical protein